MPAPREGDVAADTLETLTMRLYDIRVTKLEWPIGTAFTKSMKVRINEFMLGVWGSL